MESTSTSNVSHEISVPVPHVSEDEGGAMKWNEIGFEVRNTKTLIGLTYGLDGSIEKSLETPEYYILKYWLKLIADGVI